MFPALHFWSLLARGKSKNELCFFYFNFFLERELQQNWHFFFHLVLDFYSMTLPVIETQMCENNDSSKSHPNISSLLKRPVDIQCILRKMQETGKIEIFFCLLSYS